MGSVKTLEVIKAPTETNSGLGRFIFGDATSVFDWKKSVVDLPFKGAALCIMAAAAFEQLEEKGIVTHYKGLVVDGKLVRVSDLIAPTNVMEVDLFNVLKPKFGEGEYDYSAFKLSTSNIVIPLEVIYRNSLPDGSSVFKRINNGSLTLEDLGLKEMPDPGFRFESPWFDVGTKFEEEDIYLNWEKAAKMVSLTKHEVSEIKRILGVTNEVTNKMCLKAGLINEDGKIELAIDEIGEVVLIDAICTLDECRFMSDGVHVSKEAIRKYYRKAPWFEATEEAKAVARYRGISDWRSLCELDPEPLPQELVTLFSDLYTGTANAFVGKKLFDCPDLQVSIKKYKEWLATVE